MNHVSPEAFNVLKPICAAYAAQPFDEGKEESLCPLGLCRAEQRLAINELQRAGLLTARYKILGEKLYQIPAEHLPLLERELFPYHPNFIEGNSLNLLLETGNGLTVDLFRALLFTANEGLPITAKGFVHKKNLSRLAAQLSFREDHILGLSKDGATRELNALSAAFIVDTMFCLGLIIRESTGYSIDKDMLDRWLQLPETRMTDILYEMLIHRFGNVNPAIQHFRYLISGENFVPERWTLLSELLDWMTDSRLIGPGMAVRREIEQSSLEWLCCLSGFGWCELGITAENMTCFRWTSAKPKLPVGDTLISDSAVLNSQEQFIVQPDFEILIPPEASYSVRWTLAGCAELQHTDTMWSFRLTREMLVQASERGKSASQVISWIEKHAIGGLPSVVELSLEQWGKSIGRTSLSEVILLACESEEVSSAIADHPRLQDNLRRVGPLHFIVAQDGIEQLRKELLSAGLAPSSIIEGRKETKIDFFTSASEAIPSQEMYTPPVIKSELGLLRNGNPFLALPAIKLEQKDDSLFAGDDVPQIWSKEWRHYHSSTAQKVMEQGLKWGVKVRFSLEEEMLDFIPSRISRNPWKVSGQLLRNAGETVEIEEIELTADHWKEMKLVIPK